jgi:hypothetical protein
MDAPGFRRRVMITPRPGSTTAELEDDWHWMAVTLHHADGVVTQVEPLMVRGPWTTCPGALQQVKATFEGQRLVDVARRGDKTANCTHLYDLSIWAAAHAGEDQAIVYDISASDPVDGAKAAVIRRDGEPVLAWTLQGNTVTTPGDLEGLALNQLGPWIAGLDPTAQEAARLLRWVTMMSFGRQLPIEPHSSGARFANGACFTFQAERAQVATRVENAAIDFSARTTGPLAKPHAAI